MSHLARAPVLLFVLMLAAGALARAADLPSITVITRGSKDPFSLAVILGAMRASRDYEVPVTVEGPEHEPAAEAQIGLLIAALEKKPAVLCIDPVDPAGIIPFLQKAQKARVPVVAFDTDIESPIPVTTAATDDAAAGALAAYKVAALVGGNGAVGLLVDDPSHRRSASRRDGFLGALKRSPGIRVSGPAYSGGDPERSFQLARSMMQADPGIRGFFGADEASVLGIARAVQELVAARDVAIVGFGAGSALVEAVRGGLVTGAVVPDPIRMGYRAVEAAVTILKGRKVPRRIDTGFHWYDKQNMDDPAIAALLNR